MSETMKADLLHTVDGWELRDRATLTRLALFRDRADAELFTKIRHALSTGAPRVDVTITGYNVAIHTHQTLDGSNERRRE